MTCKRYEKKLALYAGGDLPANDAKRVEAHLHACASCRASLEGIEASREALSALHDIEPPSDDLAAIRQAVREGIVNAAPPRIGAPLRWGFAAAVCAVAVVCAALYLINADPPAKPDAPQVALHDPTPPGPPPAENTNGDEHQPYAVVPAFDPGPLELPPPAETDSNPSPNRFKADPVLVKMYTNNPNIIVILLGDREEDTNHETTT